MYKTIKNFQESKLFDGMTSVSVLFSHVIIGKNYSIFLQTIEEFGLSTGTTSGINSTSCETLCSLGNISLKQGSRMCSTGAVFTWSVHQPKPLPSHQCSISVRRCITAPPPPQSFLWWMVEIKRGGEISENNRNNNINDCNHQALFAMIIVYLCST